MAGYLVDNSAWLRAERDDSVRRAIELAASRGLLLTCSPQRLEYLFSSKSPVDFQTRLDFLGSIAFALDDDPRVGRRAEEIQRALAEVDLLRAVTAFDVLIAAYASVDDATVLHYDSDFDHLARAFAGLRTEWVVPRGSVD